MDFTDWIAYEYDGQVEDDYDYYLAGQVWKSIYHPSLFFIGLNPRWQMYRFLPAGINVMYSAGSFWDSETRELRRGYRFKPFFGWRWLDSGGYNLLNIYGYYPFSVINYANLVAYLQPHFYATMDYSLEPSITRLSNLETNESRIQATVAAAIELVEWENQLPGKLVPVIQGYSLSEYLFCLELYREAGLIRQYMAVGSMCRRRNSAVLGELISGIHRAAQEYGCERLHFFGLKLSPDLIKHEDMIWSRDSAVCMDCYDPSIRIVQDGRRFPRGQREKKVVFESFLLRLKALGLNYLR